MKKALVTILSVTVSVGLMTIFNSYTVEAPKKKEPAAAVAAVGTQEKAVAMINDLIAQNGAFSVQIASPELPIKVKLWQRKGIVKLPTNIPWETFKKDAHQFGVDLHTLLEKDEKGVYYHIEALRKDSSLYNALAQMSQKRSPGRKTGEKETAVLKIGKQPTQVLLRSINLYATSFYQQKLLERIKAVLKGFEEQAKKLRAEAEQAQKTAEQTTTSYESVEDFDFTDIDMDAAEAPMDFGADIEETDFSDRPEVDFAEELPMDKDTDFSLDWGF